MSNVVGSAVLDREAVLARYQEHVRRFDACRPIATAPVVDEPAAPTLTARELDVLQAIADGGDADALGLSEHTLKTYVRRIIGKLGARNRAQAIAIGFRAGWIS
jgi:DNA-binding NarL/FixJ family response regulator